MRFEALYGDMLVTATETGRVSLFVTRGGEPAEFCVAGCDKGAQFTVFVQLLSLASGVAQANRIEKDAKDLAAASARYDEGHPDGDDRRRVEGDLPTL